MNAGETDLLVRRIRDLYFALYDEEPNIRLRLEPSGWSVRILSDATRVGAPDYETTDTTLSGALFATRVRLQTRLCKRHEADKALLKEVGA
jgi:hypothetical protein